VYVRAEYVQLQQISSLGAPHFRCTSIIKRTNFSAIYIDR